MDIAGLIIGIVGDVTKAGFAAYALSKENAEQAKKDMLAALDSARTAFMMLNVQLSNNDSAIDEEILNKKLEADPVG